MLKKIIISLLLFWSILVVSYTFWDDNLNTECTNFFWDDSNLNQSNWWCPILETTCSASNPCKSWFTCSQEWFCEVSKNEKLTQSCNYNINWSWIFWNAVCDSCPCDYSFDFLADIRKCDNIVPAITSLDWTSIYSVWNYYQIK